MLAERSRGDMRMPGFEQLHGSITDLRDKQIFFIGGTAKSGTTWLRFLLDAHPAVSCSGEGHFLDVLAPALKSAVDRHSEIVTRKNASIFREFEGYPHLDLADFTYVLASCVALLLIKQSAHKPACAIGEKTPNNSLYFAAFSTLFPKAKFIHIVRDGRDCAVSGWFHNLRVSPEGTVKEYGSLASYVRFFAEQWATEIATAQRFIDQHPGRVYQFRYKDLFADPEAILDKLFAFLGVETTQGLLAQCRREASFEKLSGGRKPGQENRSSFFRKGVPGDWRNHLSERDNAAFLEIAGRWLQRFGFTEPA